MNKLLKKEMRLAAHPLSYFFIAFSLMTFIPGYPILLGAFFVCLGIFYSYQQGRESDDVVYTVLLPVRKSDVVRAKFAFAFLIQMISFILCAVFTVVRQTALPNAGPYLSNPMMNANAAYLGFILVIFALFNLIFIRGFFKTAYKIGFPFIRFIVVAMVVTAIAETLHHIPGLEGLNATSGISLPQVLLLIGGLVIYCSTFLLAQSLSIRTFEKIDL